MRKQVIRARLMEKTRAELMEAAMRLGLPPLKSRAKKADWADHVLGGLDTHRENLLLRLTLEAAEAMKAALSESMLLPVEALAEDDTGLLGALLVLEDYGLAEMVDGAFHIEPGIAPLFSLDEADCAQQRLQDNLFDYMTGLLLHVGMMPLDDLLERTVALLELPKGQREGATLLCHALLIARNGARSTWEDEKGVLWATSERLEDPEMLYRQLSRPAIAALDYPVFDDDALAYSARDSHLPGSVELYMPLLQWLVARDVQDPEEFIVTAVLMAQNEQVNDSLQILLNEATLRDIAEANQAAGLMINLFNSIPRWSCKGHSPREVAEKLQPRPKVRMPGKTDPCPCGSGRKYGQCCGLRLN